MQGTCYIDWLSLLANLYKYLFIHLDRNLMRTYYSALMVAIWLLQLQTTSLNNLKIVYISHCISVITIVLHVCPIFLEIKNFTIPELNWDSASKKE